MPQLEIQEGASLPDWRLILERRKGKLHVVENAHLKEQVYTTERRPAALNYPNEPGDTPVVVLDLHQTLTPSKGFLDVTEDSGLAPPFPGVAEALAELSAGGCHLVLATAGLSPLHSDCVIEARRKAIGGWLTKWGLPISFVTGKISAHTYYDDRMVPVKNGDWVDVMENVMIGMKKRYEMDEAGIWRRKEIPDAGHEFAFPDPEDVFPDQPRPFSTPIINVDVHRCLSQASSSKLEAVPKPGAVEAMKTLYDAGFLIHLSCAGWDPSTHAPGEWKPRLAGMRQWCRKWGIPWDEFVSKPHGDPVFIDDKGIRHTDWKTDLPMLMEHLAIPHPTDEVTAGTGRPAADLKPSEDSDDIGSENRP